MNTSVDKFTTMAARSHLSPEILSWLVQCACGAVGYSNKFHPNRLMGFRAIGSAVTSARTRRLDGV